MGIAKLGHHKGESAAEENLAESIDDEPPSLDALIRQALEPFRGQKVSTDLMIEMGRALGRAFEEWEATK